jgi:type II secretory pathway pseudopilin PulG
MRRRQNHESGFSIIELMVVLGLITLIVGVVFTQIATVQKRAKWEGDKTDAVQESREFADQIVRDLHHSRYPGPQMYQPGVLISPAINDYRAAAGVVKFSPTVLWFEGDVDGDGHVDSVRYMLQPDADGNCPCVLQRSQVSKVNGDPMSQGTNYTREVDGVVNSAGSGGPSTNGALTISGTTQLGGGAGGSSIDNNTLYGPYAGSYVFRAFDADGNEVAACDLSSNPAALQSIATITTTLNVMGGETTVSADTRMRPTISVVASAHVSQ